MRKPFGNNLEAYARPCYEFILQVILRTSKACLEKLRKIHQLQRSIVFIIRGSSGIGKSTFLAYFVGRACVRSGRRVANFALFYGSKSSKTITGDSIQSETKCYVVLNGETVLKGNYGEVRNQLDNFFPNIDRIIMDDCSMPFDLSNFTGTLVVAGSPSLYVENLMDSIIDHYLLTMPPLLDREALEISNMLGVEESVVRKNLEHMAGITRYLFGLASDRAENRIMVHSLVLWKDGNDYTATPSFELVSLYAEKLVVKKLCLESAAKLKSAGVGVAVDTAVIVVGIFDCSCANAMILHEDRGTTDQTCEKTCWRVPSLRVQRTAQVHC
eukprot:scaffold538_cov166-Amphora_coffeaeformis.AAC.20